MPTASLQPLLAKSINYSGMFPPCSLALQPAFQNHAKYVWSPEAWMLNTFVLPVEQFDSTKQLLSQFDPLHPLRVAALGPKTGNADAFLEALGEADAAIRSFSRYDVDLLSISHLEMFLPHDVDLALLEEARSILGDLPVFWETPPDRAEQTAALLAEHNSDEDAATFGYKLRTGGVTADAFPTSTQIAGALVTPATHQLPIKFTAGRDHPPPPLLHEGKRKKERVLHTVRAPGPPPLPPWECPKNPAHHGNKKTH